MENSTPDKISFQLLSKYFAGECSDQEKSQVEEWAAQGNQHKLSQLKVVWTDTGILSDDALENHQFDVDQAWDRFRKDVIAFPEHTETTFNPIRRILQIAAVVIVVVGVSIMLNLLNSPELQTIAASNETITTTLPDSSFIALNKNSTLEYPKEFEENIREVKLKGEAFFEVTHNPEQPFVVVAGEAKIKVLGTSFNVQAYEGKEIVVAVEEGKVALSYSDQQIVLTAGMVGTYSAVNRKVEEVVSPAPDITYWKNKKLVFKGTPLKEVISTLNNIYGAQVLLENEQLLGDCKLSATFQGEDLQTILDLTSTALNLTVNTDNGQIVLQGEGCE